MTRDIRDVWAYRDRMRTKHAMQQEALKQFKNKPITERKLHERELEKQALINKGGQEKQALMNKGQLAVADRRQTGALAVQDRAEAGATKRATDQLGFDRKKLNWEKATDARNFTETKRQFGVDTGLKRDKLAFDYHKQDQDATLDQYKAFSDTGGAMLGEGGGSGFTDNMKNFALLATKPSAMDAARQRALAGNLTAPPSLEKVATPSFPNMRSGASTPPRQIGAQRAGLPGRRSVVRPQA